MKVEVTMPDLGTTESKVTVLEWLVEEGSEVERGQPLVTVETDKSSLEVESLAAGTVSSLCVSIGDEVENGAVIAILETQAAEPVSQPVPPGQGMFARNRQAAKTVAEKPAATPLSATRRIAAGRLSESKRTIPHFYLETSAVAGPIRRKRDSLNPPPVWDAFFVQAAARAVTEYPRFADRFTEHGFVPSGTSAIGAAVDVDGELFIIGIDAAAEKSVAQISEEIRAGVERIRGGEDGARKLPEVNLTVSNLGGSRIERFTAVINPPESAILAVGRIHEAVVAEGGIAAVQERVFLTLSVDHRLVNGKYAADFFCWIVDEIERGLE